MEAPPNFGAVYTAEFRQVFKDLAREHKLAFLPFFLDGVAGNASLNNADGIHPNPAGARIVYPLKAALTRRRSRAWRARTRAGADEHGDLGLRILMYHRVVDEVPGQPKPTWNVTPRRFREQLAGLLKRGFQAWPLRKVLECRRRQSP